MRARLVVFPVRGRNWAFNTRWVDPSTLDSQSKSGVPSTLKELWKMISSSSGSMEKSSDSNVELVVDFFANKMNKAWTTLEKAPPASFKSRIHGLGLKLLSGVKPSENFLKSIPKNATNVEITYPSSLNARLVRRRLRHVAFRGAVLHKKYFYGSVSLLPVTGVFAVLPFPNIPFFWILFRSYSHWRALKGSEKLLQLVSDGSFNQELPSEKENGDENLEQKSETGNLHSLGPPWVLKPCDELQRLLEKDATNDSLNDSTLSDICQKFKLDKVDILKYRNSL